MKKNYKWGIIGPGRIAHQFAGAAAQVPEATLYAVASREINKAKEFAKKYSIPRIYEGYEALINDPEVEAIYIATPHTFHHPYVLQCLENGKPVLCEKPMSVNFSSTQELVATARRTNTFLMEAMWTRFLPVVEEAIQLIGQGAIGDIKHVKADFGFNAPFNAGSRLYDLRLGGGSLLDVGVYCTFLALCILGEPDEIKSIAHLSSTGADVMMSALLHYRDGRMANIFSSIVADTPLNAEITGTKGIITLQAPWYKGDSLALKRGEAEVQIISLPFPGNGFEFEIAEVMNCLDQGLMESPRMPLDLTLQISKVMNTICDQSGLRYTVQAS